MTTNEETRLIAAARRGESRAFASLVDANQQAVRGFLRRFTGDGLDGDDIAQEAFVTAWARLDRFEGKSSFRAWVIGIGYRIARDARRANVRAGMRDRAWLERRTATARRRSKTRSRLRTPWRRLPEDQRAAVALCLGEGFSHGEAAEILNMPLGTVKSHVTRGRARLLAALGETDE